MAGKLKKLKDSFEKAVHPKSSGEVEAKPEAVSKKKLVDPKKVASDYSNHPKFNKFKGESK